MIENNNVDIVDENNIFSQYKIYVVEDDLGLRRIIQIKLEKENFKVETFAQGKEFIGLIANEEIKDNLILLDYNLPDTNAKDLLQNLLSQRKNLNFIIMTGYGDEKIAVEMMKLGVKDYLVKDINFLELLPSSVKQIVKQIEIEKKLKETKNSLLESEEKYRLITENSKSFISETDINGVILYVNNYYIEGLGYLPKEIIGKRAAELLHPDDLATAIKSFDKMLNSSQPRRDEWRFKHKNGTWKWLDCTANMFTTKNGEKRIVVIAYDITDKKEKEEDLKNSKINAENANEAKTQFLANMSHELRTPINGILGMVNLLSKTKLEEQQINYLDMIKSSGSLLLNIVNDILDISKIESGKFVLKEESFNIINLINKIHNEMEIISNSKNLKLNTIIENNITECIFGDEKALTQILINLLTNAIKFTDIGQIDIKLEEISKDKNEIKFRISVSDTGIGIQTEKLNEIFERFTQIDSSTTKKYQGTGLGLSIVKKLIEIMKGKITVESSLGKGTVFTMEIPFKNVKEHPLLYEKEKTNDDINSKIQNKNINILIAEDNAINALFLKELLEQSGFSTDTAQNGIKVLEKLSKKKYNLVFMDVQMPEMDGFKTTEVIRKQEKNNKDHIIIVALTAYSMKEDKEKCIKIGMDDYISKPIEESEVFEKIEKYFC
ncbi:MAG: hypothetical protein A2086_12880 [Spirochaetes bacterium GWD1_27_9]|nr:MAG: hypothetical protein A2Z98_00685 [Spirochaetes bacterium GWB1_27_13]OHD43968.1 MAG: hypothetical protein A2086_12880 [Spirochaetes bacterium GWD1_27_9]